MTTQADMRQLRNAVEDAVSELEGAERYDVRQRAIRRGATAGQSRARPTEVDVRGFPIPQPMAGFAKRVGQLLNDN
jgi:hypothetical protein